MIPSCTSETNPAKYEPISCGDCKPTKYFSHLLISNYIPGCQLRFTTEANAMKKLKESLEGSEGLEVDAPRAQIIAV